MRGRQGLPAMGMGGLVGPGMGYPGPPIPPGAFGDGRLSAASWAGHDPKMMQQWEVQGGNAQAFQRLSQGGGLDPSAWEAQGYPGGHMGPIPGHPGGYAAGWWHGQLHHYPMPGMPHMPGMMPGMGEGMVWPGMAAAPPPGAAEAGNMPNAGPEGMGPWQGMGGWVSNKVRLHLNLVASLHVAVLTCLFSAKTLVPRSARDELVYQRSPLKLFVEEPDKSCYLNRKLEIFFVICIVKLHGNRL